MFNIFICSIVFIIVISIYLFNISHSNSFLFLSAITFLRCVTKHTFYEGVFSSTALGVFQNPQRCVTKPTKVCCKTHHGVLENTSWCVAKHTFTENTSKGVLNFGQAKNTPFGGFCNTP